MFFREATKLFVHTTVSVCTARSAQSVIINNTDVDPDSLALEIGTGFIGEGVALQADVVNNRLIDRTFDWFAARKQQKQTNEK